MTKVCHITSVHNSNDTRIFYKECTSLAKAGYDTYLVARGECREENGVHIIGVGQPSGGRISRMTDFARRVFKKAVEIDAEVYHLHDPELLPYGVKLKNRGKKVIFDSHENTTMQILEKKYLPAPLRKLIANAYLEYETRVVRRLDAVVVTGTLNGKDFFEGRAQKTCLIANYPTISGFYEKYDPVDILRESICYVGGLAFERGITNLVKAAYLAKVKLILVGSFSSEEYQRELEQMPEYSCVDYRGVLPNTEVPYVLLSSFAGMNTLLDVGQYYAFDTFGVKVYEYMSLGLPIINNDAPYQKKMNEKYRFGICVNPMDIDAIANAIIYLQNHHAEAYEMGQNGRRAIEQEFNWSFEENKLLELYESLNCERTIG